MKVSESLLRGALTPAELARLSELEADDDLAEIRRKSTARGYLLEEEQRNPKVLALIALSVRAFKGVVSQSN